MSGSDVTGRGRGPTTARNPRTPGGDGLAVLARMKRNAWLRALLTMLVGISGAGLGACSSSSTLAPHPGTGGAGGGAGSGAAGGTATGGVIGDGGSGAIAGAGGGGGLALGTGGASVCDAGASDGGYAPIVDAALCSSVPDDPAPPSWVLLPAASASSPDAGGGSGCSLDSSTLHAVCTGPAWLRGGGAGGAGGASGVLAGGFAGAGQTPPSINWDDGSRALALQGADLAPIARDAPDQRVLARLEFKYVPDPSCDDGAGRPIDSVIRAATVEIRELDTGKIRYVLRDQADLQDVPTDVMRKRSASAGRLCRPAATTFTPDSPSCAGR